LLGSFRWNYNDGGNYGGIDREDEQLTVLIEQWHDLEPPQVARGFHYISMEGSGLIRVIKEANGYLALMGGYIDSREKDRVIDAIHKLVAI
jgi:hypothetical protein